MPVSSPLRFALSSSVLFFFSFYRQRMGDEMDRPGGIEGECAGVNQQQSFNRHPAHLGKLGVGRSAVPEWEALPSRHTAKSYDVPGSRTGRRRGW